MGRPEGKNLANFHYSFYVEYYRKLFSLNSEDDIAEMNKKMLERFNKTEIEEMYPELREQGCYPKIQMKTQYPGVLIGIGYNHESGLKDKKGEIQLGFSLDYVTGMPYLPGSSVKGILKQAFQYEDYIKDILKQVFQHKEAEDDIKKKLDEKQICVQELKSAIFDGIINEKRVPASKRDVFYDAVVLKKSSDKNNILEFDYITPHGHGEEREFMEPNPIIMMKIGPNVTFEFCFALHDTQLSSSVIITPEDKIELFTQILEDFGIGAKTNVGYGVLSRVKDKKEYEKNKKEKTGNKETKDERRSI